MANTSDNVSVLAGVVNLMSPVRIDGCNVWKRKLTSEMTRGMLGLVTRTIEESDLDSASAEVTSSCAGDKLFSHQELTKVKTTNLQAIQLRL